ncbi:MULTISPECIES: NAD(P)-binding domain-containing protein [unclassified Nitratiruptor]|uniref:NAD(P)-binding domain-containing protein n=1 Tax=unclassified Nitratiruptor TaxID=2624044 RepID=UPI001915D61F|nr:MULTISPECIES: NAD(P)-binding domain-containing protein [unclassified Nitratiruptor]BCD61015.1 thioredoxin reductase (NADPH) [Nitratiruptor sp. YY08-10]BCD64947.1 thioredoxin reductase (NADPH) [Nitratiruptor sp. YY08-14]
MKKIYNIAIIGAGPAGIGTAIESFIFGIKNILLIEKAENHSATIRTFYKDNKRVDKDWMGQKVECEGRIIFMDGTKETTLDLFDKLLDKHKIETQFNTEVEKVEKKEDIFIISTTNNDTFQAKNVVIAIGKMGKPNKPSYKIPPSIRQFINFNLDKCQKGEKILVVGGGNSAAEYAYFLADTNDVTLNYRREKFTRLNPENERIITEYANKGKLKLKLGVDITALESEHGKPKVNFTDGSSEVYDRIIYAIGGTTPTEFLKKCGIEVVDNRVEVDENYETKTPGLFAAGDIVTPTGGSIAIALNHGYHIAKHIKERLGE